MNPHHARSTELHWVLLTQGSECLALPAEQVSGCRPMSDLDQSLPSLDRLWQRPPVQMPPSLLTLRDGRRFQVRAEPHLLQLPLSDFFPLPTLMHTCRCWPALQGLLWHQQHMIPVLDTRLL